ncbi:MAG: hypothetical protein QG599_778 [Pseudomonadota bacterium]|nr:hypothetical protein [Pseudomonadota bacterium]
MNMVREWRLKTLLGLLLVVTLLAPLGVVNNIILLEHLPRIARENSAIVRSDAERLVHRMELLMGGLQSRLMPLEIAIQTLTPAQLHDFLDAIVGDGSSLNALYVLSPDGRVENIGSATVTHTQHQLEMIGNDLSTNPLYREVQQQRQTTWSDRYLSVFSNTVIVGLAVPVDQRIVIGEIPLAYLLHALEGTRPLSNESIWIIDRRGEIVSDTESPSQAGLINMLGLPLVQQALRGESLPDTFHYQGRTYYVAARYSQKLNWLFLVKSPAGIDDPLIRSNLFRAAISFFSLLVVSLLLAPMWAARLAQPVRALMQRARQIAEGDNEGGAWPRGVIFEVNCLSADLERMAGAILEREQKSLAIFNASPVAMMVCDTDAEFMIVDINQTWIEQFGYTRAEVIGRQVLDIDLSLAKTDCVRLFQATQNTENHHENKPLNHLWLLHRDGRVLFCDVSAQQVMVNQHRLMIWVMEDVTEKRRIEREIRALNAELEERVARRTEDLAQANRQLSSMLSRLRYAQRELVQAEKLAALGELVAGVAHELNTPIGNGLMAASTLEDRVHEFQKAMQGGLRRSDLDNFVAQSETAAGIIIRNLHRAAELVTSFKQIAVDRASSQRRTFDLKKMIDEILMTLQPTLKRTPHEIIVEAPEGLLLDSYPGPLGQALINLINNTVLHAFDEGQAGVIRITANADGEDRIQIRVCDNGKGIPADLLKRIFNPFVTTKKGRGGTGLGLHVTYNAVTNILGGRLMVWRVEGQGAEFEIRLPKQAPQVAAEPTE